MTEPQLSVIGEYGIGFGSIETTLDDQQMKRFLEIIQDSIVPASFDNPITCGDERPGEGTLASTERTEARIKLFGGLVGVYGGFLTAGHFLGEDPQTELSRLRQDFEAGGVLLGGHTDTTGKDEVVRFIDDFKKGVKQAHELATSKCGANDAFATAKQYLVEHGTSAAFSRLIRALDGDNYDVQTHGALIEAIKALVGRIPNPMSGWKSGYMMAALADRPEWVEVLVDDGQGVHGHRGAVDVANNRPYTTIDRRQVADKVARDDLLCEKKPNCFVIDNWAIPRIAEVGAQM